MIICEQCGKNFFNADPPPDECPDCGDWGELVDIGEEEYAAEEGSRKPRNVLLEKTLTDEEYERLMKLGAEWFSDQEFIRSWYFCFDKINKSNKKSLDSLINSVFCLMKAGSVRQYYFSERKFTETVHEKISDLLEFAPDNLEALEFRAELWKKQAVWYDPEDRSLRNAYAILLQIHGRRKDDLETKFSMAEILLVWAGTGFDIMENYEQKAVKLLEDILASPIQKSRTLVAKVHSKLADVYSNYPEMNYEKIYDLATLDKIFDTNDPTFGLIFARTEFMNHNLKSSLYVCKWLLPHHYSESMLWFLLAEIFGELGNKNYEKLAFTKYKEIQVWVEQISDSAWGQPNEDGEDPLEGYEDILDFYNFVEDQKFSKEEMREHMEKTIKLPSLPDSHSMNQDKIMGLSDEERSFESILAELKEEDDYSTNQEQEIKLDEDYAHRINSMPQQHPVEETGYEDAEEAEDNEDDYLAEQLEKYGLTEEEISAYQNLAVD